MNNRIKRILLIVLVALALLVAIPVAIIAADAVVGPDTADYANTTFTDTGGNELLGYLAEPDGPGPHPAVMMLHEWWGLNQDITLLADALAAEGYVVFVPDAYRGRVTSQIPRALYLRLGTPEDQVKADLDAALDYLMSRPNVDPERVASLGFCFGGGHSLLLSLRHPETIPLTIIYYGDVIGDPATLAPLVNSRGVLGIFGENDQQIPVAEVAVFEQALTSLGIPNEVTIYPGVGHAFLNAENYDQAGPAGEAWQQTLDFLAQNLDAQ
jgi:carboxymethylenebutenolidase